MKIQIIHNPGAGDADHSRKKIIEHFESPENVVQYYSTDDDNWKNFLENKPELIVIAGGDGTFHKVAALLLEKVPEKNIPIRIMPLGTANNISKTIQIHSKSTSSNKSKKADSKNFSAGRIKGIKDESFFFESVGFGVFPELVKKREGSSDTESAETLLPKTLEVLQEIISDFEPKKARLKVNGMIIKGWFILIELMNIKYIGPNLQLSPQGNPEDDFFELVLISKHKKSEFKKYLKRLLENDKTPSNLTDFATVIRTKKVKVKWKDKLLHVDDKLISDKSHYKLKMKIHSKSLTVLS